MNRYLQILLTILGLGLVSALGVVALFTGAYYYVAPSVPQAAELREIDIQVPLQVYTRDGRLIDEYGERKRTPVDYEHIPPLLVKAVVAAEDEYFFEHPGIDWRGIIRGAINELRSSGANVGGSTITQQVPRTLEVLKRAGLNSGFDRFVAKFKEMILAYRMEQEFTKEEILELYLNTGLFGGRLYGVATAAQAYFGKGLDELSVSEIAILAGIPQRPNDWNPVASVERATARRAYVLRRMHETGAITDAEYQTALAEPVVGKMHGPQRQLRAQYVGEMVRAEMVRRFGDKATTAGLRVTTTIDSRLQAASNEAIRKTLMAYDERHGYRGPLAHVELGDGLAEAASGEPVVTTPADADALRALLDDYPTVLDYESAIVLAVEDLEARVFFSAYGEQSIGFDAVEWAWPFITDDTTGPRPKTVAEVLAVGDVVRFRRTPDGGWRLAQIPEAQGAFVSIDPLDGAIVALNGGFDFFLNNFNRATQASRQPGSSFKPFVYSAAFEHGFNPASVVVDAPVDAGYQPSLERVWRPENFAGEYFGPSRLRFALLKSMNSVSIKILQTIGVPAAVAHVKRFGFDDTAVPKDLTLALGSGGVAPVKLAAAYATFANGGYKVTPYFIDRVVTADGEVLYESKPLICPECNTPPETPPPVEPATPELVSDITELYPKQRAAPSIISPQNAYLISDMLLDVVRSGSGNLARRELRRNDLAGKTGTTNDGRDTWFVGFNADVIAAAWVGFDEFRPLGGNEQGGVTAIPMWIDFMREALDGMPEHLPKRPPGIVEQRINPDTGQIACDTATRTMFEKFDVKHLPERENCVYTQPLDPLNPGVPSGPVKNPFAE